MLKIPPEISSRQLNIAEVYNGFEKLQYTSAHIIQKIKSQLYNWKNAIECTIAKRSVAIHQNSKSQPLESTFLEGSVKPEIKAG